MSDAWLRRLAMVAIVLLVLHAVGTWAYSALGVAAAIVSALLVAAVSVFSARMANDAWFAVPTVVFTALPLAGRLFSLMSDEHSWWTRSVEFAPFLIGFAAPVLLLLLAYVELGRRASRSVQTRLPASQRPLSSAL